MNNNNLSILKQNLSRKTVDFLSNIPSEIFIDKKGRALYFRMPGLDINSISNFIYNIEKDDVILINPFLTANNNIKDPYICISRQFLLCHYSDPILIYSFLLNQIETCISQYNIESKELYLNLYFKHKKVSLSYKEF